MTRYARGIIVGVLVATAAFLVFSGHSALAQISIDFPTDFAGFSSQDIRITIANIVRIVLGFIGILFVLAGAMAITNLHTAFLNATLGTLFSPRI